MLQVFLKEEGGLTFSIGIAEMDMRINDFYDVIVDGDDTHRLFDPSFLGEDVVQPLGTSFSGDRVYWAVS